MEGDALLRAVRPGHHALPVQVPRAPLLPDLQALGEGLVVVLMGVVTMVLVLHLMVVVTMVLVLVTVVATLMLVLLLVLITKVT